MNRSALLLSLMTGWGYALAIATPTVAQIVPTGDTGTVVTQPTVAQPQWLIQGGTQAGGNLFQQFQQFGVATGQTATFQVNPAIGNIFSRVTGGSPSLINGLLQVTGSNANLFLINPAGVIFGKNARLDLPGSFTATTAAALEFNQGNWLNVTGTNQYGNLTGNVTGYAWLNNAPGSVVNAGQLAVQPGKQVMLTGGTVINTGTISAPGGQVTIAAVPGEKLVRVTQDNQVLSLDLPVAAKTELAAGQTPLNPTRLPQLLAGRDVTEATGIVIDPNGDIKLRAGSAPIATAPAQSIVFGNVSVADANPVRLASTLPIAPAPKIDVTGERIDLQEANLNASTSQGGGQIRVGGDAQGQGNLPKAQRVNVDAASHLTADATVQGNGGKVIVWSDNATQFAGQASAKGGAQGGDGGLVETSGKQTLNVNGARVEASAAKGKAGEWLLDPSDITIANGGTGTPTAGTFDPATTGAVSTIAPTTIEAALDSGTNVTISTAGGTGGNGDIQLTDSINQTGGGTAGLTLTGRRFTRNPAAQINLTTTGDLTFNLNQVNQEATPPTASIQNAIDAIGTVPGARQINLGTGNYQGVAGVDLVTVNKDLTINGAQPGVQINGQNTARNVFVAAGTTATLKNLAVINGFTPAGASGAGILNQGRLILDAVGLINNQAGLDGGAIVNTGTLSILGASQFTGNQAAQSGGAIRNDVGATLSIANTTFNANTANGDGGGIWNSGTLRINSSTLSNNRSSVWGGAVVNHLGDTTITGSTLTGNSAGAGGGALHTNQGSLAIVNSTFANNQAQLYGGALDIANTLTATISQTVIQSNRAVLDGGGIILRGDNNLNLQQVTLDQNQAGENGGAINVSSNTQLNLDRVTVSQNQAQRLGGGIFNAGTLNVKAGSSIGGNTANSFGGGIRNEGKLTIEGSTLWNNRSVNNRGGAISNINGLVNITGSAIIDNTAISGGGLESSGDTVTIDRTLIRGNQANGINGLGAGIFVDQTTTNIILSGIEDNRATGDGGGIYQNGGVLSLDRPGFVRNISGRDGGAIANIGGQLDVFGTTFTNNQANRLGGGIYNTATLNLKEGLIDANTANVNGGGIWNQGALTIDGATLSNNRAVTGVGGGLYTLNSVDNLTNTSILNNSANTGGGIRADSGGLTINNSTLSGNAATTANGGGISAAMTTVTINGSQILNNTAFFNGAGIGVSDSTTTIRNTTISGNIAQLWGGGIEGFSSTLLLDNLIVQNNQAASGGGIFHRSPTSIARTTLTNSIITNNQATSQGGGLALNDGIASTIAKTQITNNTAQNGGGLFLMNEANARVQNTVIQGNQAVRQGGGIMLGGNTSLDLTQSTLAQNQSTISGGGLKASQGTSFTGVVNITDSTIQENRSPGNGGGIDFNPIAAGGTLNLTRSTVNENISGQDGGGIASGTFAIVNFTNSTVAQNQANRHGGGIMTFGTVNLFNTTVAANQADANGDGNGQGGGLYKFSSPGLFGLTNSLVANNQVANNPAANGADAAGNFIDQGNNLIGMSDGSTGFTTSTLVGTGAAPINPLLATLGNYGGLTQTIALLPGSQAIDAGNSTLPTDQRGIARVGATADIGAFESRGFILVGTGAGQTAQINTTFANPLQVTIASPFGEPVDGGQIFFTAPSTGAGILLSPNPLPVTIAGGIAQLSLTANAIDGTYDVAATANGIAPTPLTLTNTVPPPPPVPPVPPVVPPIAPILPIDPTRPAVHTVSTNNHSQNLQPTMLETLDTSFTQDYTKQFDSVTTQKVTSPQIQRLLSDLDEKRGVRSAVIYAMFVPESFSPQTQVDSNALSAPIPTLIRATERQDSDRLELIFITAEGKLHRRSTNYQRSQVEEQSTYFWLTNNDVENPQSFQQFGQQMQQWLFAPIQADIQKAKINGLLYVLDQGLRSLPLAAMQTPKDLLLKDYTITVVPSLGMLDRQQTILRNQTTLAMGASKFQQLADLPSVPQELAMIQQQGFPGRTFLNEQFTLANLVEQQQAIHPGILHLATHADFNAGEPQNSFIQLHDQRLSLDHIDRLNLRNSNLELLILSACNTATGDPAAELGFTGMASLFGVRTAIGSLWSVSDLGTFAFMTEFYGRLVKTPSRADALRQTQLAMQQGQVRLKGGQLLTTNAAFALPPSLQNSIDTTFTHPYYWSGFAMVGNPW